MSRIESSLAASAQPTAGAQAPPFDTVFTPLRFDVPPAEAWRTLMFYEQIDQRPPLYLRLLLPVPIRTEGKKSAVGDRAFCHYEGGHLIKEVTAVDPDRYYGFSVVEQALRLGGNMRLRGGNYTLRALADGGTEVTACTHYSSQRRPRWLWLPIEAAVCHLFHRHILRAMRRASAALPRTAEPTP